MAYEYMLPYLIAIVQFCDTDDEDRKAADTSRDAVGVADSFPNQASGQYMLKVFLVYFNTP